MLRWLMRLSLAAVGLVAVAFALAVLNNNASFSRLSRADFVNGLADMFALYLYRKFNGDTPDLNRVMDRLERRIDTAAALDFRVSDLYLQRIAFLLAAGRIW